MDTFPMGTLQMFVFPEKEKCVKIDSYKCIIYLVIYILIWGYGTVPQAGCAIAVLK